MKEIVTIRQQDVKALVSRDIALVVNDDGTLSLAVATANGGSLDVALQDQTTNPVEVYLSENLKTDISLTAPTTILAEVLQLSAGHGFTTAGEWVEIYEDDRWYQAEITGVTDNAIDISIPIGSIFTTAAVVYRVGIDMNVDGSGADRIFDYGPKGAVEFDIVGFSVSMASLAVMDGGKFGGIAALGVGMLLRRKVGLVNYATLMNVKRNQDMMEKKFMPTFTDKAPAGEFGLTLNKQFGGQSDTGVVVRLDPATNEVVQAVIRDALHGSANLSLFRIAIIGHVVVP